MKKLLALLLLSPLMSGDECVGLPGKEFHECLKAKMSTTPDAIELECKKIIKSKDVFFSVRLIRLLPEGEYGEVESVLFAEKIKSEYSAGGIGVSLHDGTSNKKYRLSRTAYRYEWNDRPEYEGIWQDAEGKPTQGLLNHLQKPHTKYKLNRENLKLTVNPHYGKGIIYQCEIIENIGSRKSFYENEVNLVLNKKKELKIQKEKEQKKKNKI